MSKAIPELSGDTRLLIDQLRRLAPGEVISYAALSDVIGRDVRASRAYGLLSSARRRVLRDDRIVIEAVHRVGMKRLDDAGIAALGSRFLARIRHASRAGRVKLSCVEHFDALPRPQQMAHWAAAGILAIAEASTKLQTVRRLEQRMETALPLAKMLDEVRDNL